MRIPEFTEDQIRLLETVYAGFIEAGDWPTTAFVDWKLDSTNPNNPRFPRDEALFARTSLVLGYGSVPETPQTAPATIHGCLRKYRLPSPCGPLPPPLRSFCGPACREQPGTDENDRPRVSVLSRLSPTFAARLKVLNLRLFIGE